MKKRRLMIQVSVLIVIFYILAGVFGTLLVYRSASRTYLTAKDDMISRDIEHVRKSVLSNFGINWFFEYSREHCEEILAQEEFSEGMVFEDLTERDPEMLDSETPAEEVSELIDKYATDDEKIKMARSIYDTNAYLMDYENNEFGHGATFVIAVGEDNLGFVYYQADEYASLDSFIEDSAQPVAEGMKLGDKLDLTLSEHPAIQRLISSNTDKVEFEIVSGTFGKSSFENHYTAYCPIFFNGKIQAAVILDYNWDEFRGELMGDIKLMVIILAAGIIVFCGLMILLLHRVAVKPLSQLQAAVNEYSESKDSSRAVEMIGRIKSGNEIGMLAKDVSALAAEIDSYMKENLKLVGERERVAAEMDLAAKLQADILPSAYPAFPDRQEFDIYATMDPAKEVGGDLYDFFLVDDDHLALAMADVAGKGIPASLYMMMTKILIQNFAMMGLSPAKVIEKTNDIILSNNEEGMFVTVWFGILEISTGKITAVNAGHEYPVIRTADGQFELYKDKHGMAVGSFMGTKYTEYELQLEKGGALFLYTDGVPEAFNSADEMFGIDRMLETLNAHRKAMPVELLTEVKNAVDAFAGEAEQSDDVTLLEITLI